MVNPHLNHRPHIVDSGTAQVFDVWHEVPLVPQGSGMSCWAAAAAMLVGWRHCLDIAEDDIVSGVGAWEAYRAGLDPSDIETLCAVWQLQRATERLTLPRLKQLLVHYGPLWVGEASPGLHVIVVTGVHGDGSESGTFVRVLDPWPKGRGDRYTVSFANLSAGVDAVQALAGMPACVLHTGGRAGRGTTIRHERWRVEESRLGRRALVGRGPDAHMGQRRRMTEEAMTLQRTIVVDCGHGGHTDAGRSSPVGVRGWGGAEEKTLTLDIGRRLERELRGHRVILTRSKDESVTLGARAAKAREANADVFLSLHFNGSSDRRYQGTESWVEPRASAASRALARRVNDALARATGHPKRGVLAGRLGVLDRDHHAPSTAACLAEISYLTDPREERRLAEGGYRAAIAQALADAVRSHLRSPATYGYGDEEATAAEPPNAGGSVPDEDHRAAESEGGETDCGVADEENEAEFFRWVDGVREEHPEEAAAADREAEADADANADTDPEEGTAEITGRRESFEAAAFGLLLRLKLIRSLTPSQEADATKVYKNSIDFRNVYLSPISGKDNRAFVFSINGKQIMNCGTYTPSASTFIHELAHVWQSQHHTDSKQFMWNSLASQMLEWEKNLAARKAGQGEPFSAYAFVPGKSFGEYAAEQIAVQVERGDAKIVAHVSSVAQHDVDAENEKSLSTPRVEDTRDPKVVR